MRHVSVELMHASPAVIAIAVKALFLLLNLKVDGFVSLASGSRAHDVGQAITPQGQLWGVCF